MQNMGLSICNLEFQDKVAIDRHWKDKCACSACCGGHTSHCVPVFQYTSGSKEGHYYQVYTPFACPFGFQCLLVFHVQYGLQTWKMIDSTEFATWSFQTKLSYWKNKQDCLTEMYWFTVFIKFARDYLGLPWTCEGHVYPKD